MIYALKDFQRNAVDKLKEYFEFYFKQSGTKEIVFKSPTGSGKTFMASSLFEELANDFNEVNFCVLWCCPGKGDLQKQSYDNVKTYLGGNPTCTLLEDSFFGSRSYIKKHEIVFVNWEKLVQKDKETGNWVNNLMKDQEGKNFMDVIKQTRSNETKIILVIDESHIGASAQSRIKEFIDTVVTPNIVLKMSATPLTRPDVKVEVNDVIEEGLIKKDVIVNEGISESDRNLADKDSELLVLEKGYEKRLELLKKYQEINSIVNPLALIQIPNVDEGEAKKLVIKDFLRDKGITEENGLLKLWCDNGVSFDKKKIRRIDDKTEFLIFKTAVATGWDCPRAQILIKFREGKSETFEIQTIGRILRTPEAKSYEDELLDNAYIFTNIQTFETTKDTYNPNRIKTLMSYVEDKKRLEFNEATHLRSFYRSREGNYNSADSRFYQYFLEAFMNKFGFTKSDEIVMKFDERNVDKFYQNGVSLDLDTKDKIISESILKSSGIDKEQSLTTGLATVKMADNDIQTVFNNLIKDNLNGLAYVRSKSPITGSIIESLCKFYDNFDRTDKSKSIQRIVVNNYSIFASILSEATLNFKELLENDASKKGVEYDFKLESKKGYSMDTHKELENMRKSIYQPLYVLINLSSGNENKLEAEFLKYLEHEQEVMWYWENGAELMRTNFGIPYNNGTSTFQPDFIVKFKHNYIGIFDTKASERNKEDTRVKAKALANFINKTNKNRGNYPKVIGGIVIKENNQFYVNINNEYKTYIECPKNWIVFDEIIKKISNNADIFYYLEHYKD